MATDLMGTIGTTLKIATGVPATYDEAGIDAVEATATLVGFVETMPEFGGTGTVETFAALSDGELRKAIGIFDYGQMSLTIGKVTEDAGQVILKDGFDGTASRQRHTAIVTLVDGSRLAFTCLISSNTTIISSAGPFLRATVNLEIDAKVLPLGVYTP